MKTHIGHLLYMIDLANKAFYADLFAALGWRTLHDGDGVIGFGAEGDESVWFAGGAKAVANDYDGPGLNHFAFGAESQADVDAAVAHLAERGIAGLFGTPRYHPEYSSERSTYYHVMFESPDRLLFEVVYTGPKQD